MTSTCSYGPKRDVLRCAALWPVCMRPHITFCSMHPTSRLLRPPVRPREPDCHCRGSAPEQAYERVTSIRPCGPKRDAVRGATFDLLDGRPHAAFGSLPSTSYAFLNDDDRRKLQVWAPVLRDSSNRSAQQRS